MASPDWSSSAALLRCPLCEGGLQAMGSALRCQRDHSFDIAREGYVNLLAPGRLAPKLAGDSKEMLRARRAFLGRGHYQTLSGAIDEAVAHHIETAAARALDADTAVDRRGALADEARSGRDESRSCTMAEPLPAEQLAITPPVMVGSTPPAILDAGCGEGYYLARLAAHLRAYSRAGPSLFGMDIAKEAVRMAARRYPEARFVVADVNARWPFADASMAVVLDIFAPRNPAEFARVLAPGGLLLVALPTRSHLAELRQLAPMLQIEPGKQERVIERLDRSFALAEASTLEYALELSGADAALLLRMTPSARHAPPEALAALAARDRVRVTAGFELLALTRRE